MVYFTAHIHDNITENPFTIDFTNFATPVDKFVEIDVEYIGVVATALSNPPAILCLNSDRPVSSHSIHNVPNPSSICMMMNNENDIYTFWETSSRTIGNTKYILGPGVTDITFTVVDGFTGQAIIVPAEFQEIVVRFDVVGE